MAYSYESSSVKTIVPGAEVSGFADVVARQKISTLSSEVPKLSAGEGIDISTVDGKTVITNNISAGENISLVYDMETNTYRIDAQGGGSVEGLYVPLSATACSIGSNNSTVSYSLAQGLNNVAKYGSFAQAYNCSADNYSLAQGNNNSASYYSIAQGTNNRASYTAMAQGDTCSAYSKSLAVGYRTSAGYGSLCLGEYASAGTQSLSIGGYNKLESTSFAVGNSNTAKWGSVALGYGNHSAIATSFCFGYANTGNNLAAVFGKNLILNGHYNSGTMALGTNNKLSADVAFVIGNGTSYSNRSDCFAIYPDGSVSAAGKISANGVELGAGKTYTGVAPIQVNNTTDEISITGESLSAGPGIDMFSSGGYVVVSSTGKELSAGPGIDLFESGGYFVISGTGGNSFPMTGTDGTTNYTANANFSSFTLTTGQGAAGCYVNLNAKGVHFEAYPATDVSASWYNIITHQDKITCSAVKLSTASDTYTFYTSAVPNLNKITFIAPSYGPYETYSALIDDGDTTFAAEVDSGCCITVVRCWNDDRNKNCWCGLNQETYFYIG